MTLDQWLAAVAETPFTRESNPCSDLVEQAKRLALAHLDEPLHVSALCELLGQSQPAVSHHLSLMRMTGLVGYRRDGKHNFYHLRSELIRDLLEQFFADSGNGPKQLQFVDFAITYKRK